VELKEDDKKSLRDGLTLRYHHYWLIRFDNDGTPEHYPLPMLYRSKAERVLSAHRSGRTPPTEEQITDMMIRISNIIGEEGLREKR